MRPVIEVDDGVERRMTFLLNLNDDFDGGETTFQRSKVDIEPQVGQGICFIHELKHAGLPILSGTKYLLRGDVLYAPD